MNPHAKRAIALAAAALASLVVSAARGGPPPTLPTPALLADDARDYGLSRRAGLVPSDLVHVRTLLRASMRLDPRQADVQNWLYELAVYEGDAQTTGVELAKLCELDPTNESAFAHWLATGPSEAQTSEKREAWLKSLLAQPRPPDSLALLHVHLGRLALQRLDRDAAREHLADARRIHRNTPEVAALAIDLLTPDTPAAERVAAMLEAVRFNPTDVETTWRAGEALDEFGFFADASLLYEHALRLHRSGDPKATVPTAKLMRLALNAFARGDREDAARYASDAVNEARGTLEPALLFMWMASTSNDPSRVELFRKLIRDQLSGLPEPDEWPVNIVAQAAWYYCLSEEELPKALMLAEKAAARAPHDPFVQRALGWAQAANQKIDEARQTLAPLATTDPFAAYKLIELNKAAGNNDADGILTKIKYIPPVGPARSFLERVGLPPLAQTAAERFPEVAATIRTFDKRVLSFDQDATRIISVSLAFEFAKPDVTQPWWLNASITNNAPYAVTLGPEWMIDPVFLLSFRVESDAPRDIANLFTITLDRTRVLDPGETVRLRRTIDVGPLRRISRQTPQRPLRVTALSIFDPERDPLGDWRPGATGQLTQPAMLDRRPLVVTPDSWNALFAAITQDDGPQRYRGIEALAQALGERQRWEMKPSERKLAPVPAERIERALNAALQSASWETRARTLDALQLVGLDQEMIDTAAQCLSNDHWLVRMLAVRLLARQGPAFRETAQRMAEHDADELVRDMARSFVARWAAEAAASTQPAAAP